MLTDILFRIVATFIILFFVVNYMKQEIRALRSARVDQFLHVLVSFILFFVLFFVLYYVPIFKLGVELSFKFAFLLTFVVGLMKEMFDRFVRKTGFSWDDLKHDFFGMVYGLLILGTLIVLFNMWWR